MATNVTYHYAKDGRQIAEGDIVIVDGKKARVEWDCNNERWVLNFTTETLPLNLFGKDDITLTEPIPTYQ